MLPAICGTKPIQQSLAMDYLNRYYRVVECGNVMGSRWRGGDHDLLRTLDLKDVLIDKDSELGWFKKKKKTTVKRASTQ